jgi:hypothetical protein
MPIPDQIHTLVDVQSLPALCPGIGLVRMRIASSPPLHQRWRSLVSGPLLVLGLADQCPDVERLYFVNAELDANEIYAVSMKDTDSLSQKIDFFQHRKTRFGVPPPMHLHHQLRAAETFFRLLGGVGHGASLQL